MSKMLNGKSPGERVLGDFSSVIAVTPNRPDGVEPPQSEQVGKGGLIMTSIKTIAATMAAGALTMVATSAEASPGSGVSAEVYAVGMLKGANQKNSDGVKFQTKDDTNVLVQKVTFAPGSYSGWHHHPGVAILTVKSGLAKITFSDCSSREYGPGSPNGSVFTEGEHQVHQFSSDAGATVIATFVAPYASPPVFRVEEQVPFCAQ